MKTAPQRIVRQDQEEWGSGITCGASVGVVMWALQVVSPAICIQKFFDGQHLLPFTQPYTLATECTPFFPINQIPGKLGSHSAAVQRNFLSRPKPAVKAEIKTGNHAFIPWCCQAHC